MSDVIERAREMGWRPQEEFRGDPERWVDAETYVARADTVLPIVKAEKLKLERQLEETRRELEGMKGALKSSQDSIAALEEFYTEETKRQVDRARSTLKAKIREARDAGNLDDELDLNEELTRLNAAEARAVKEDKKPAGDKPADPPPLSEHYKSWAEENAWFNVDAKKTRRATVIAAEIAEDMPELRGKKSFYDELDKRLVAEGVKEGRARPASKVEGGDAGDAGGRGDAGGGKGYEDLPAEAKAMCKKQGERLVGKDKRFKTEAEWRKYYAEVYFKEY